MLLPALKSILSARPPRVSSAAARDDVESSESKNRQPSYRLAWVGSDSATCHVGTSLHKVPLARLQEMYLLLGYGRWELLEVIRILGPFPNVRNTLKGDIKVEKIRGNGREGAKLEISYLSMIDGTRKEILAGKEDNTKVIELDVWFANDKAIVCSVPREDGGEGGWSVPLGVHKVVCSLPGLKVATKVKRGSSAIIRKRRENHLAVARARERGR